MFQQSRYINNRGTPRGGIITYTEAKGQHAQSLEVQAVLATLAYRNNTKPALKPNKNCATVLIEYEENGQKKIELFSAHSSSNGPEPENHGEQIAWRRSQDFRNRRDIEIKNIVVHSERSPCNIFEENKHLPAQEQKEVCRDFFNRELAQYGEKAKFICSVDQQTYSFRHPEITEVLTRDINNANMLNLKRQTSNDLGGPSSSGGASSSTTSSLQSSQLGSLSAILGKGRDTGDALSPPGSTQEKIPRFMPRFEQHLLSPMMRTEEEANKLKTKLSGLLRGTVNEDSIKKVSSTGGQWQIKVEGTEDELRRAHKIMAR